MSILLIGTLLWLYLLWVLSRAKLHFWHFIVGSIGLFVILMFTVQPVLTMPLARAVSALAGVVGTLTDTFTAYFKYGIIFVGLPTGSLTLTVDFECSGIIEILAYLCLLSFFPVYKASEKLLLGVVGTVYIMLSNALRIVLICLSAHIWGMDVYFFMHTFVGRVVFYGLSILLYFLVFTKSQVIQMKVGNFSYGND